MTRYTYKIVPAPERARKIKGAKRPEERFARTLEEDFNALAEDGWEFVRSETFEIEEPSGLMSKRSVERRVMVFRKPLPEPAAAQPPLPLRAVPEPEAGQPEPAPEPVRGPRILGRPVPPISRQRAHPAPGQDAE